MSALPLYDPPRVPRLLDELLAEQRTLSAVDTFARRHEEGSLPARSRTYEERIPVGTPGPGQQLAFRVDLDACTGCKACVTACHNLNGLAPEETWRDVGLLVGEADDAGFQQTVTTACHHCEDPACLTGCPVQAYEKDPVTGIVAHLDDQCIGCQYCVLKCPYDVPKYSAELGIVRKCDMCAGRLAEGEEPACVQGCPNAAIAIEIVERIGDHPTRELLAGVNGAIPDSAYTRPTTRYVSDRPVRALLPADLDRLKPAQAHDPLAVMLVGLQLSVGTLLVDSVGTALTGLGSAPWPLALAAVSAVLGLGAATLHLGRPLYAFRAFLGWRTSWMSREILVFGAYAPTIVLAAAASALVAPAGATGFVLLLLRGSALAFGLAGTACSIMIYVDTHRSAWSLPRTGPLFAGTLLGLGALGAALASALGAWSTNGAARTLVVPLLGIGLGVLGTKVAAEAAWLGSPGRGRTATLDRTARLLLGPLRARVRMRFACAGAGLLTAVAAVACALVDAAGFAAALTAGALVCFALGELVERHLYFTSEASSGMPGP